MVMHNKMDCQLMDCIVEKLKMFSLKFGGGEPFFSDMADIQMHR